jgi:hypothetical protein
MAVLAENARVLTSIATAPTSILKSERQVDNRARYTVEQRHKERRRPFRLFRSGVKRSGTEGANLGRRLKRVKDADCI